MFSTPTATHARPTRRHPSRTPVPHSQRSTPAPVPAYSPSVLAAQHRGDGMDVDEDGGDEDRDGTGTERVLLKDDDYSVSVLCDLPMELRALMGDVSLQTEPVRGAIDDRTGYAYLLFFDRCVVWRYLDLRTRLPIAPTAASAAALYTFPIVPSRSGALAQAALVPHQSREPGLLLVMPEGEARYWDSVTRALTGREKFASVVVSLADGEEVNGVYRWESAVYLLTTTHGNICRLMLTSTQGGRALVVSSAFSKPRGMLSRAWRSRGPVIGTPGSSTIVGLAVGGDTGRGVDVWVAKPKSVELWRVHREGGEELAVEQSVQEVIASALPASTDPNYPSWDIQLLDLALLKDDTPAVLFSFAATGTNVLGWSRSKQPSYAIATMFDAHAGELSVGTIAELQYQVGAPLSSNQVALAIPQGGRIAFVQFPDTVIMRSLIPGSLFYEEIPLRDVTENRYLGYSAESPVEGHITYLTAQSGLVGLAVNVENVNAKAHTMLGNLNREQIATEKLKERIEHAVYYGGSKVNPLSFDFRNAEIEGDLSAAIEEISKEIVSSSYKHKPVVLDLDKQLRERLDAARELIAFIKSNNLLGRLSIATRWSLCMDAEKVAAAKALWTLHEEELRKDPRSTLSSILATAVARSMTKLPDGDIDGGIRHFFQHNIEDIGLLVDEIGGIVEEELDSVDVVYRARVTREADHLVMTLLSAAQNYRRDSRESYDILEDSIPVLVWTETRDNVDLLQMLSERTEEDYYALGQINLNHPPTHSSRAEIEDLQQQLKYNLLYVAKAYFTVVHHCGSYYTNTQGPDSAEHRSLKALVSSHRKSIIMGLVNLGHIQDALRLAEQEKDWETLVDLCTDESLGATPALLEEYIYKHKEAFAFELYQRYYQNGNLYELLEREAPQEVSLLDTFLRKWNYNRIAWIHDIKIGNFEPAATALREEGSLEKKAVQKKTILSLGKLCALAQLTVDDLPPPGSVVSKYDSVVSPYNTKLGIISVHEELVEHLTANISLGRLAQPDALADTIAEMKASGLGESLLTDVFKRAVKRLVQGQILSVEDLVDVLTLKDNRRREFKDYGTALKAFSRVGNEVPRARADITLEALWRRVFLHDDWRELKTSDSMSDAERQGRLRGTATYATLAAAFYDELEPRLYLRPSNCRHVPDDDECRGRFENFTPQQIEGLQQALQEEIRQMEAGFTDVHPSGPQMGLEYLYDDVWELLKHDKGSAMQY